MQLALLAIANLCGQELPHKDEVPVTTYDYFSIRTPCT